MEDWYVDDSKVSQNRAVPAEATPTDCISQVERKVQKQELKD